VVSEAELNFRTGLAEFIQLSWIAQLQIATRSLPVTCETQPLAKRWTFATPHYEARSRRRGYFAIE
jgi:hypothetical protein